MVWNFILVDSYQCSKSFGVLEHLGFRIFRLRCLPCIKKQILAFLFNVPNEAHLAEGPVIRSSSLFTVTGTKTLLLSERTLLTVGERACA